MFNAIWEPDSNNPHCFHCKNKFTTFLRRHHCRKCGKIFCNNCMKRVKIFNTSQIICISCIDFLNNSILINYSDLYNLKNELTECRENLLELTMSTNNSNENTYTSSNIITYNTNSTQTYIIYENKSTQTNDISTNEIDTQTANISTNEISIQTDTPTNSNSFTEINKKTKSLDILECIENVSKKKSYKTYLF